MVDSPKSSRIDLWFPANCQQPAVPCSVAIVHAIMESYTPLLERTRVPQPSLQKFAVISIFEKLRSAPPRLGLDSDPGRNAITYCINSTSPAVVDQSVRELCRLVKDSQMDISRGLLELQSALEASDPRFVTLFVKALGYLVKLGFQKNPSSFRFQSADTHPYVKVRKHLAETLVLIYLESLLLTCHIVLCCRFFHVKPRLIASLCNKWLHLWCRISTWEWRKFVNFWDLSWITQLFGCLLLQLFIPL